MLKKHKLGKGKVRVTFSMPALEGAARINLVGDFNSWSLTDTPMTRAADGSWSVSLTLDAARKYEYRYLADGQTWHNDWQADAYVSNAFGSENSVLDLAEDASTPEMKSPARKKAKNA